MSQWDRIQRLELENARLLSSLNRATDEVLQLRALNHALRGENAALLDERDRARDIAVALEQEVAALDVVYVPVIGEAT